MDHFEKLTDAIPLVLHKIVFGDCTDWEDVQSSTLGQIISYIQLGSATFCDTFQDRKINWLLTFDDGNASDYDIVFPMLLEANMTATFFVITDRIGQPGYLNWRQVEEMWRHGMCIGSHSHSHYRMTELSSQMAEREFVNSKIEIEDRLGCNIGAFSFPYGANNKKLYKQALTAGYNYICSSSHGAIRNIGQPIPRNSINSKMSWETILRTLNPNLSTRLRWLSEDMIKSAFRMLIGDNLYRQLRNKLID